MVEEGIRRISDLSSNMLNYAKEWTLGAASARPRLCSSRTSAEPSGRRRPTQGVAVRRDIPDSLPPVSCDPQADPHGR